MTEPQHAYNYRDLFQSLPIGLYQASPDGHFLEVNDAFLELLGYPDAQTLLQVCTPELYVNPAAYQTYLLNMTTNGMVRALEVEMKRHDNTIIWVEINARSIHRDGKLVCNEGSVQDITSRVNAWRISEKRYFNVVEKIREVLFTLDRNGNIQYVNQAWHRLTGYPPGECLGKKLTTYFESDDSQILTQDLTNLYTNKYAHMQMQGQLRTVSGALTWVEVIADAERSEVGEIHEVFGMVYDISERKRAEDEMRRAFEKERELNALRTQFVSMTSHEFRTPLSSILTSAELIEHYGNRWSFEKNLQHLKRIQNAVQQIISLMDDMLIIGRSDAGKLAARREPELIEPILRSLIDEVRLNLKASHVIRFDPDLPPTPLGIDKKLLRQIFSNLLSNALKYSEDGSHIHVRVWEVYPMLCIRVQDNGIGIPESDQGQLFESFYRASNVGDRPGTGLGLPIVKRSVEAHGGHVTLMSSPGNGTTITVHLNVSLPNM